MPSYLSQQNSPPSSPLPPPHIVIRDEDPRRLAPPPDARSQVPTLLKKEGLREWAIKTRRKVVGRRRCHHRRRRLSLDKLEQPGVPARARAGT